MIRSMTGYGRARTTVGEKEFTVELRSVNSRFLDCSVRISRNCSFLEDRIKPYLQSRGISRGKVDVFITLEMLHPASLQSVLNEDAVKDYLQQLYALRDRFGLQDDISVMKVAQNPDLYTHVAEDEDEEKAWEDLRSALSPAVDAFLSAREREGKALETDLRGKLDGIRTTVDQIEKLSEDSVVHYRERLAERIRLALADNQITPDENRILTEAAIYADKVAVDEELVRLRTHFASMEQILSGAEPVGRKLDFLLQEMNREINTTGSKCNNAEIAALVVNVKCELEKIREQIQNLE